MTYQVKSFKVLQTSAMAAMLYFILSLLIAVPMFLISLVSLATPEQKGPFAAFGSLFFVFLPFIYAILGFVFTALGCLFYNLIAKFMGGIAFNLEEMK